VRRSLHRLCSKSSAAALQREAHYGLAQRLYEGVELGSEGLVGLITYSAPIRRAFPTMRLKDVREFIAGDRFGPEYLPPAPNIL